MKKISFLLLIVLTCLSLTACNSNPQNTTSEISFEDKYYAYAQSCIDSGDEDKAKEVLKEGIEKTDSEKLQKLLDTLEDEDNDESNSKSTNENQTSSSENVESESQTNNWYDYPGEWNYLSSDTVTVYEANEKYVVFDLFIYRTWGEDRVKAFFSPDGKAYFSNESIEGNIYIENGVMYFTISRCECEYVEIGTKEFKK